jgi:hypothetical protein
MRDAIEEAQKEIQVPFKLHQSNIVKYFGSFSERNIFHVIIKFAAGVDEPEEKIYD